MIILQDATSLADFLINVRPHLARMRKTRQPLILTVKGKAKLVTISANTFLKIKNDLEIAEIKNQMNEIRLELFRTGKISAEQLRSELRPNPRALGIPAKKAFALIRRRIRARRKRVKM